MGTWIGVTGGVAINLTFLESEGRKKHTLNYNKVHMPSPQQFQLRIKLMVCQFFQFLNASILYFIQNKQQKNQLLFSHFNITTVCKCFPRSISLMGLTNTISCPALMILLSSHLTALTFNM